MPTANWERHTERLIAQVMLNNELNNAAAELREAILSLGMTHFAAALRETTLPEAVQELLTSDSYYSAPYVWNVLRASRLSPVPAAALWKRLRRHWAETGADEAIRAHLPLEQDPILARALSNAVTEWESALQDPHRVLGAHHPEAVMIAVLIDLDRDFIFMGHSFHHEWTHPVTAALHTPAWPLPVWHHTHHGEELLVAIVPSWVADQLMSYAHFRKRAVAARPYPVALPDLPERVFAGDTVTTALALLVGSSITEEQLVHAALDMAIGLTLA